MADEKTGRRCGTAPRRTATGGSPLRVRHHHGRLTVTPRRRSPAPPPRRGNAAAVTAVLAVLAAFGAVLGGIRPGVRGLAGPCPDRTSSVLSDAGHTLRLRLERGITTLIHLCADPGTSPVTAWKVAVTGPSGATAAVAVQAVGERLALAAAQLPEGSPLITVTMSFETGARATFGIRVNQP